MDKERIYFRPTTAQQRRLLFERWAETGNVTKACQEARVSRRTFYRWKSRFDQAGYAGLETAASHTPKEPHKTLSRIEQQVIEMRRQQPDWGKQRIADELSKANNWVPVVSPNTVRRILQEAGLWSVPETTAKKGASHASPGRRRHQDRR